MMDVELKLEQPKRRHAVLSALVMGIAYALGKYSGILLVKHAKPEQGAYSP
jgi:hypothetical protein